MSSLLGEKIRRLRTGKGYSLDKLAELTETSKSYLWDLENREAHRPSADKINKVAAALDVTPEYLLSERDVAPDEEIADEAFFRKFRTLDPDVKKKLRKIMDAFDEE
ncbi:helix-turn-helix transcriptional regulator [Accumulibacter sp.]|uniref:helix-turn-helix domain-containing protein n=1 Tax=Accumulibacter sp. TaxID=2053492 RepID=UPI002588DC88|nr:helix-turn-helix transcriptional regulator [Accumulibacter sp.]